jgi:hypothetical protein
VAVLLSGSPASAGGWAVTTLDAVPQPRAGQAIDVGFTIRQHGMTPVNLDGVAIVVRDGARDTVWPARRQGATGHYVARITFPAAGTVTWSVNQGWFPPQDLGRIQVAGPSSAPGAAAGLSSGSPESSASAPGSAPPVTVRHEPVELPLAIRLLLPAVAIGAGALAVVEIVAGRRHRRVERLAAG